MNAISRIYLYKLRNDTHFQLFEYIVKLVREIGADKLGIGEQFAALTALHAREDEVLKKILKSELTERIEDADHHRDDIFRGMVDANRSAMRHYNDAVRGAARRLGIPFDAYGDVTGLTLDDETSAVHNLMQELLFKHGADVETVGLNGWITELDRANVAVEKLIRERADEEAGRTKLALRKVRAEVDEAYRVVAARVEALALIGGDAAYADFIDRLNALIDRTNEILAQQRGRRAARRREDAANGGGETPAETTK